MNESTSSQNNYTEANRLSWNETAEIHLKHYVEELYKKIADPAYSTFDKIEEKLFSEIGIEGKNVIQLCCNNARELICVKKRGAARCVGVDISDGFIEQGRELALRAGVDVELVRSNVYDLSADYYHQFDIVYITIGAMGWLPDLAQFFKLVNQLLKPSGQLFIYEVHPILNMFDGEKGAIIEESYFRKKPYASSDNSDYFDPSKKIEAVSYWFPHRMADVIQGCIQNELNITHFEEYAHDISNVYRSFEGNENQLPMCYSLLAQKKEN